MKRLLTAFCAAIALAAFAAPALAAPTRPKPTRIDIEKGDDILGTLVKPGDMGWIRGAAPPDRGSLIEYRRTFLPELFKATENL